MRPAAEEHAPYYSRYIDKVPDGSITDLLRSQGAAMIADLRAIPASKGGHRYAPDKWTIRDVVQHISDAERIFAYRALRIARGDATPMASFDENAYAPAANAEARTLKDLIDELEAVRASTVAMFASFDDERLTRMGTASGQGVSVRALGYIMVGHGIHHMGILRERYL